MDHSLFNPREMAALYVAEVLDDPQLGDFRSHLVTCEECSAEVAYWRPGTEALENIKRFMRQSYARKHERAVVLLLLVTFLLGVSLGLLGGIWYGQTH